MLACYGAITSLLYGVLLNLSFWPFTLRPDTTVSFVPGDPIADNMARLIAFSLVTSLGWDIGRAITTTVLILLTGPAILRSLTRAARRAAFGQAVSSTIPAIRH
jgi:energy-coupling factor transport system substrate-specific component